MSPVENSTGRIDLVAAPVLGTETAVGTTTLVKLDKEPNSSDTDKGIIDFDLDCSQICR